MTKENERIRVGMASKDTKKKHTKVQEILENNSSKPKIIRLLKKDHNSDKKTF